MKYDTGKPNLALIPPEVLEESSIVMGFGVEKYGMHNWRYDGHNTLHSRTYASLQRHLNAYWRGEDIDPESGQRHLAHAMCQLMFLMVETKEHPEMDDRYVHKEE